jgi:Beta protein
MLPESLFHVIVELDATLPNCRDGGLCMAYYVPILKGRTAEFQALSNVSPEVLAYIRPLLEVVPNPDRDLYGNVLDFGDRAMNYAPKGMILTVDCDLLDDTGNTNNGLSMVSRDIYDRGIRIKPVLTSTDPSTLATVRDTVQLHGEGACLRLRRATERSGNFLDKVDGILNGVGLAVQAVSTLARLLPRTPWNRP